MRHLAIWRLAAILLIATVALAAIPSTSPDPTALADNGHGDNEGRVNQDDNDGNRGHGNDPDGHDEDNPGNSSGPGSGRDEGRQIATVPVTVVATAEVTVTAPVRFDASPAATEAPATGTIAVEMLTCAGVPADTTDFDWFGACQPGAESPREIAIAPSDASAPPATATTDAAGEATFEDLAPGDYRLELVEDTWCHAASDAVTADSEVVVEAGATSTVWIFVCDGSAGV